MRLKGTFNGDILKRILLIEKATFISLKYFCDQRCQKKNLFGLFQKKFSGNTAGDLRWGLASLSSEIRSRILKILFRENCEFYSLFHYNRQSCDTDCNTGFTDSQTTKVLSVRSEKKIDFVKSEGRWPSEALKTC